MHNAHSMPRQLASNYNASKSNWYNNALHTKPVELETKRHQNRVKVTGEYLTFPGGGTQFKHGALHYIRFIQKVSHSLANMSFCIIN